MEGLNGCDVFGCMTVASIVGDEPAVGIARKEGLTRSPAPLQLGDRLIESQSRKML